MKFKSINEAQKAIKKYYEDREWKTFPGDLAKGLSIEASEVLEIFLWEGGKSEEEQARRPKEKIDELGEELSDILWYVLALCNSAEVDVLDVFSQKFEKNVEKYPVEVLKDKNKEANYWAIKKKYRENKKKG